MDKRGESHWWSGWRFGRPARPSGPDFADLGTAFGLDAALDADAVPRSDQRLRPWTDLEARPTAVGDAAPPR